MRQRPEQMAEPRCAWIGLSGPVAPGLLDDLDSARISRDSVAIKEWGDVIDRREIAWTIVPGPNRAELVFAERVGLIPGVRWSGGGMTSTLRGGPRSQLADGGGVHQPWPRAHRRDRHLRQV